MAQKLSGYEVLPNFVPFVKAGATNWIGVLTVSPGQDPTQLSTGTVNAVDVPVLSPDGLLIAWVEAGDIKTIAPDGSGETIIFDASAEGLGGANMVSWSPDSQFLLFDTQGSGATAIRRIPAGGGAYTSLYTDGSARSTSCPAYNFDGTKIAFCVLLSASSIGIWVMNADGSSPGQLDTMPTQFSALFFSGTPFSWFLLESRLIWNDGTLVAPVWKAMDDDGTNVTTLATLGSGDGNPLGPHRMLPDDSAILRRESSPNEIRAVATDGSGDATFYDPTVTLNANVMVLFGRVYFDVTGDIYSVLLDGTDERNESSGTSDSLRLVE